jgi:menaquinol-cytochrome c reductase iron-sulfur subunit
MIWAIAGVIGLSMAVPLAGFVISPGLTRRPKRWVDVGSVDELGVEDPKQLEHITTVKDGYIETKATKAVWAVKHNDGQIIVFSPLCPHLGCGYRWDGGERQFKCPCHESVYSITGEVLAGPAPRPLDTLPEKIENGRLLVMYEEYKSGLSVKVKR